MDVVESRLGGRKDLMADLMYHLVISLSEALTQQMDISAPQTLMEPEYRYMDVWHHMGQLVHGYMARYGLLGTWVCGTIWDNKFMPVYVTI